MYSLKVDNKVSLFYKDIEILSNIRPWVFIKGAEKEILAPEKSNDKSVSFKNENGSVNLTLSLKEKNGCFGLFLKGNYVAQKGMQPHLTTYPFGFDYDFSFDGNLINGFLTNNFWQRIYIGTEMKKKTQMLMFKKEEKSGCFLTVCDKDYRSLIFPEENCYSLWAYSNTVKDDIDDCVLIGSYGLDEYASFEEVCKFGLSVMKKPGKLRRDKKYPEIFEYLGWCSWDAFHMDVTEQNLIDKVQEFKDKEIPVNWIILDDMWGDVSLNDLQTMHSRELNDWEADKERFPNGLKGAVTALKTGFGIKVGIWHPITGYWHGINPNSVLAKREKDLLEYTCANETKLVHSFDKKKILKYYDRQHKFYRSCKIDFTKVDNQGILDQICTYKGSLGECSKNLHNAIEKTANKYYGGALINCMGMCAENYWNRTSNINRFSDDFKPEDRKWFIKHILQCSYNSLSQGAIHTGDWDMWWSDDAQAKKNAVIRSMSGGPIYMSDELGRSVKDVIMPTVFQNGRIIRLENPAVPCKDSLFDDAQTSGNIFKLFNRIGDCGVLAAFNLDENENEVSGEIKVSDIVGLNKKHYCLYDWFNKTAVEIKKDDTISLSLKNYDDFRLYLLIPIENGKAVIGLKEKYMSPATIKSEKNGVTALDDGTLLVYSEKEVGGFDNVDKNLYALKVKKGLTVSL